MDLKVIKIFILSFGSCRLVHRQIVYSPPIGLGLRFGLRLGLGLGLGARFSVKVWIIWVRARVKLAASLPTKPYTVHLPIVGG